MRMHSDPLYWSAEKLQHMREQLVGPWAEDIWVFTSTNPKHTARCYLRFHVASPSIKVELKYALWTKFEPGQWSMDAYSLSAGQAKHITCIIRWLDRFTPPA